MHLILSSLPSDAPQQRKKGKDQYLNCIWGLCNAECINTADTHKETHTHTDREGKFSHADISGTRLTFGFVTNPDEHRIRFEAHRV